MEYQLGKILKLSRTFSCAVPKTTHAITEGSTIYCGKKPISLYEEPIFAEEIVIVSEKYNAETITEKKPLPSCSACKRKKAFKDAIARIESLK